MKYELTDEQIKGLLALIANSNIKGESAEFIVVLKTALQNPIKEKE